MKENTTQAPYQGFYFCDFGIKHNQNGSCNCAKEFGMFPICFQDKVLAKFPQVKYNNQITHSMRLMIIGKSNGNDSRIGK